MDMQGNYPGERRRGRPPSKPRMESYASTQGGMPGQSMQSIDETSQYTQQSGMKPGTYANPNPNAQIMNYQEYQKLQQLKLESTAGLPTNPPPTQMTPLVPPPAPIAVDAPIPLPDPNAPLQNTKTDMEFEAEQRRDLLRQEAILSGKRRFKEIRTSLGLDLYNYKNPNLTFLQKLNNLISTKQPENVADTAYPHRLQFPFRKTFDPAQMSKNKADMAWNSDMATNPDVNDFNNYSSTRRMKRRIEKEVLKQELKYHRMQMDVKVRALEAVIKLQGERLMRLQTQFDSSLAHMVKVLINSDDTSSKDKTGRESSEELQEMPLNVSNVDRLGLNPHSAQGRLAESSDNDASLGPPIAVESSKSDIA